MSVHPLSLEGPIMLQSSLIRKKSERRRLMLGFVLSVCDPCRRVKKEDMFYWLLARKWESVRFTRLFEKRRIRFSWRLAVALSAAGS